MTREQRQELELLRRHVNRNAIARNRMGRRVDCDVAQSKDIGI